MPKREDRVCIAWLLAVYPSPSARNTKAPRRSASVTFSASASASQNRRSRAESWPSVFIASETARGRPVWSCQPPADRDRDRSRRCSASFLSVRGKGQLNATVLPYRFRLCAGGVVGLYFRECVAEGVGAFNAFSLLGFRVLILFS